MTMKLETRLEACWRSMRSAPPRSQRAVKLRHEMINLQLKRMKQEIKARGKSK
jgi:hypothetical protein